MTLRTCRSWFVLLASLVLSNGAVGRDSRDVFEGRLEEVRRLVETKSWDAARAELLDAVEGHEGQRYVLTHIAEIEDTLAHCFFWSSYELPEASDVVHGDLRSWNPSNGSIKLRYRADEGGRIQGEEDFVLSRGVRLHPLLFKGPYSIEIQGEQLGASKQTLFGRSNLPVVYAALSFGSSYGVAFGDVTRILEVVGGTARSLDDCTVTINYARPYRFKVRVAATSITASYNDKRLLKVKRDKGEFGQLGFGSFANVDEILIIGETGGTEPGLSPHTSEGAENYSGFVGGSVRR